MNEKPPTVPAITAGLPQRLWPLPALASWAVAWSVFALMQKTQAPAVLGFVLAVGAGLSLSRLGDTRMRRLVIALGFPVSLAATGAASGLPGWAWLLPMALLALAYPLNTWRDAPLFPTPKQAFDTLPSLIALPASARMLDAGCGLGHGLMALRRAYPNAHLEGVEWSWPWAWATRLRCRWAHVRRGDMWADDWSHYDLVYLFQRPESLPRALAKARREIRPGAWLASLEFEAIGCAPDAVLHCPDGRPLWLYRMGSCADGTATQPSDSSARSVGR